MAVEPLRKRFTFSDYYAMADAGIFTEEDRVELIEGDIYELPPNGNRHAGCVNRLTTFLTEGLAGRVIVSVQNPVHLNDFSEPQPDIAVLRRREDFYSASHPTAQDVFFVVEAADSSLEYDKRLKVPDYARNGIAEAWLADLTARVLLVFRDPSPEGYRQVLTLRPGESVTPLAFPDLILDVSTLLG
jgi:Uma2 family endonuclease